MNRKIQKECESGCEYVLADYMGDIKKLLMARAKVIPAGKFVGEGNLEVSGIVEYEALYTDSEGKLTAISTESDFTVNFPIDTEKYVDSAEESRVCDLKVRITGPRKMALKSEIETALTVSEENSFSVSGDAFESEKDIEQCTRVIKFVSSSFVKSGEREYAEVAERFAETEADDLETLLVQANSHISEARALDGEIFLKGENVVSAIMKSSDRHPFKVKKSIPFEEKIAVEDLKADTPVIADGVITSASIGIGSENGECAAVANIIAEYSMEILENKSESVVTDAYLTDKETVNTYRDTEYSEAVFTAAKDFALDVAVDKEEYMLSGAKEILAVSADVKSSEASLSKHGVEFSGEIIVNGVASEANVEGAVNYIPIKIQSHFSEPLSFECQIPEGAMLEYSLNVSDADTVTDGEKLFIRCALTAKLYLLMPGEIRRLYSCEISEGELPIEDGRKITVYYPKKNENLFDIAKRYRTTSAKIALDNNLSESVMASPDSSDSLLGVKKLIIK